jgi:hypothetical protein
MPAVSAPAPIHTPNRFTETSSPLERIGVDECR